MNVAHLVLRQLFNNDDDESSDSNVCPTEDTHGPDIVNFVGDLTFHQFSSILSGSCAAAAILISFAQIARYAFNYSHPVQQRQIIRIILLIPWVAIFSFLIVWQNEAGEYLIESLDFGCAIALAAFLLLLCDYVLSNKGGFEELFGVAANRKGETTSAGPAWFKRCWYLVLQFLPVITIIWIATAITLATGDYCAESNSPRFAHIWLNIARVIGTILAIVGVLRFYSRERVHLAPHSVFLKFFAFKGIIGVNILQSFIINLLVGNGTIAPSKYLTYHDIHALPSLLLACEMPLFAVFLVFTFPIGVYLGEARKPAAGPLNAIVEAFDIRDLASAFVRGPMRLVREQQWGMERQSSFPLGMGEGAQGVYRGEGAVPMAV